MCPVIHTTPRRKFGRHALAAGLLFCLALAGCEEVDTLETVRQLQADGDFAGSVEPLLEVLATRPDDPEANYRYGMALIYTQRAHLAVWSFRKAMKDPEWFVRAGLQLAYAALAASDFNEVVEVTGRILEREPENTWALLMRANAHAHGKKDPELALADADRVLELDPNALEAYEPRILALLLLDRVEEASQALAEANRRLVELGDGEPDERVLAWYCSTKAAFELELQELDQANATWIECLAAHPTDPVVVSNALGFYDAQGRTDRSLDVLQAALATDPTSRTFRATLAQRLRASGRAAEAEAVLREATRSEHPWLAVGAWRDLGKLRQAYGEHGAAADALGRALGLAREGGASDPQLAFEYADALVLARRLDRALEVAKDLSVPAHQQLIRGRVAYERRDPSRALEEYDEALRLWPNNASARYYAALAAEELGDFERALAEFRFAVRISPGATDARTRGAALLLAAGQPKSALLMLHTAEAEAPLEIEGQLLSMRLSSILGDTAAVAEWLAWFQTNHPGWAGKALADVAEDLALRRGPALALSMLTTAPGVDFDDPRYAEALRARVLFAHQAGDTAETRGVLRKILAAQPDSSAFEAIRGLDLELSGAPTDAVRTTYVRALELDPRNARALTSLGRLALGDDPEAALVFFDRAVAADPSDPDPKLQAARALVASGDLDRAAERLDKLLLEHPFESDAAAERARLDLERGFATPRTLERARRAVRFGGGVDALELLGEVYAQLDEPGPAARAAERARALRQSQESAS